jgi:hypothetical protein
MEFTVVEDISFETEEGEVTIPAGTDVDVSYDEGTDSYSLVYGEDVIEFGDEIADQLFEGVEFDEVEDDKSSLLRYLILGDSE